MKIKFISSILIIIFLTNLCLPINCFAAQQYHNVGNRDYNSSQEEIWIGIPATNQVTSSQPEQKQITTPINTVNTNNINLNNSTQYTTQYPTQYTTQYPAQSNIPVDVQQYLDSSYNNPYSNTATSQNNNYNYTTPQYTQYSEAEPEKEGSLFKDVITLVGAGVLCAGAGIASWLLDDSDDEEEEEEEEVSKRKHHERKKHNNKHKKRR